MVTIHGSLTLWKIEHFIAQCQCRCAKIICIVLIDSYPNRVSLAVFNKVTKDSHTSTDIHINMHNKIKQKKEDTTRGYNRVVINSTRIWRTSRVLLLRQPEPFSCCSCLWFLSWIHRMDPRFICRIFFEFGFLISGDIWIRKLFFGVWFSMEQNKSLTKGTL